MNKIELPQVIAHRGASAYAPENTLASLRKAQEMGSVMVEFDVELTRDHIPMLLHDVNLARTTRIDADINDSTYEFVSKLDAGTWFNQSFRFEKIPTLTQALKFLAQHNMTANVEIKPCPYTTRETTMRTLACIAEHWPSSAKPLLISSFQKRALRIVHQENPALQLGMLLHRWDNNWQQFADEIACSTVNVNHRVLSEERIIEIKQTGRAVLAYTVNRVGRAQVLFSQGVDAVFSDYPDLLSK